MQVIQKLTVVSNPTRVFEVGTEVDGREVIEIKQVGYEHDNGVFSEFHVRDENDDLIASVENCPVVLDWKTIVEHGEVVKCFYCEEQPATGIKFGKSCCCGCESHEIRSTAPLHKMTDEQKANHLKMGVRAFKLAFGINEK
ncbi:hypothetical protein [Paenibacillus sp. 79R4]|uniref:hypothetical protein n=1 Tax=Paenibacillus sp. 79R4 TaxID=2212847 RepID=UPI0021193E80|nr:hypothetical protein [Paenibacillus sp. 79R4]